MCSTVAAHQRSHSPHFGNFSSLSCCSWATVDYIHVQSSPLSSSSNQRNKFLVVKRCQSVESKDERIYSSWWGKHNSRTNIRWVRNLQTFKPLEVFPSVFQVNIQELWWQSDLSHELSRLTPFGLSFVVLTWTLMLSSPDLTFCHVCETHLSQSHPCLSRLTGTDVKDAPVHSRPVDVSGSAVGCHGNSGGAGFPLCAAPDHPGEDAAAAPPLHPPRAPECESHDLIAELKLSWFVASPYVNIITPQLASSSEEESGNIRTIIKQH